MMARACSMFWRSTRTSCCADDREMSHAAKSAIGIVVMRTRMMSSVRRRRRRISVRVYPGISPELANQLGRDVSGSAAFAEVTGASALEIERHRFGRVGAGDRDAQRHRILFNGAGVPGGTG